VSYVTHSPEFFELNDGVRADLGVNSRDAHDAALVLTGFEICCSNGAALGGLFAPFAVGGVPTDSRGIAAAAESQFGADLGICHGSASAG